MSGLGAQSMLRDAAGEVTRKDSLVEGRLARKKFRRWKLEASARPGEREGVGVLEVREGGNDRVRRRHVRILTAKMLAVSIEGDVTAIEEEAGT